ncbi:hypothetical protein FSP39_017202 [Pinctada imbricata]|uniref:Uncharacterized protein n=1 Tax=Pinctada imbricata TaxID=66713 RepID=A0AA88Y147_PINIB|nr:hypothetical protein FSP39_017202 [Pinctada imbricata]
MDAGRLGIVRRQENSHRKYVCILNDVIKSRWEIIDQSISREKFEISVKHDKSFIPWKRRFVHQRVLQECMRMRRETTDSKTKRQYGEYGGKPLYAFTRDINRYISEMHPRLRRERKVRKALSEAVEQGKILDPSVISRKMETHLKTWEDEDKPKVKRVNSEEDEKKMFTTKVSLPPLRGIMNNMYAFNLKDQEEKESRDQIKKEDKLDSKKGEEYKIEDAVSSVEQKDLDRGRAVLKLPPIETAKSFVTGV